MWVSQRCLRWVGMGGGGLTWPRWLLAFSVCAKDIPARARMILDIKIRKGYAGPIKALRVQPGWLAVFQKDSLDTLISTRTYFCT